jgi:hypothetical protein
MIVERKVLCEEQTLRFALAPCAARAVLSPSRGQERSRLETLNGEYL